MQVQWNSTELGSELYIFKIVLILLSMGFNFTYVGFRGVTNYNPQYYYRHAIAFQSSLYLMCFIVH